MRRIHPDDHIALKKILRGSVPPAVEEVYYRWQYTLHVGFGSGPLGRDLLIAMMSSMGLLLDPPPEPTVAHYWPDVDIGTRVVSRYCGQELLGTFQGLAPDGLLYVQLDDQPHRRMLRGIDTRLATTEDEAAAEDVVEEEPEEVELPQMAMWKSVSVATPVLVDDPREQDLLEGTFCGVEGNLVLVRVGEEVLSYGPDAVTIGEAVKG